MSAKSKLTLALLAATALLTFNPGIVPRLLSGEQVRADEILIDQKLANDLDALTGESSLPGVETNGVNAALAPASQDAGVLQNQVAYKDAAPGDNPFQAVTVNTETIEAASFQSTTPALDAATSTATANPFVDKSSVDMPKPKPFSRQVDDSALRYYATNKDLKRLGAELRRLKSLYPDWEPPKDLFSPATNISEQPLWEIYKSGDFAKVRAQIALIQSTNPKWVPSEDLLAKLQAGETRALVNRAFAQGRWQQVIGTAQANPSILVCDEMQVLWNVAEAFAQTRNYAQSFDLYKYVLSTCDDPQLRLATVQKASLLLPSKGTSSLIALGRTNADGTMEFENVGFDGLRRQLGDYIQHGNFDSTPSDEDLRRFVDFVQRTGSGPDASLIGWYFYAQEDWKMANSWFIEAAKFERSPKHIEGVILTLRNMEQAGQALKVARRFLKASPEITDQYIEIVSSELTVEGSEMEFKEKELAEFEKTVKVRESALGGQALGWKYLGEGEKTKAEEWFKESVSWKPTEGGVIGLAVLASRAKNYKALNALKAQYGKDYAALSEFKVYTKSNRVKRKKQTAEKAPVKKKRRLTLFSRES
ncbi:MAG: hypothetical protein KL863_00715 [Rhizobium sp.]|nr:hypothetical protein [Rhizobium sp.]